MPAGLRPDRGPAAPLPSRPASMPVETRFPTVLPVLYDVDRQGYDVGRGELPRHSAGQTGAGPITPASGTVSHRLATPAGRCPIGLTMRARE